MKATLQLALEALELCNGAETVDGVVIYTDKEIAAIKEALAQPEQEPVALKVNGLPPFKNPPADVIDAAFHVSDWAQRNNWTKWRIGYCCSEDYTTPPQRKPLTDQEIMNIAKVSCIGISPHEDALNFAKVIEAVHGIKE